jgi:hypothetical protein
MGLKLGELLIARGLLTPEQVGQALQGQSIFGGKLGTNLVEMGFVTEEQIAATLSQQLGLPCARPQWVANIPRDVIACVSKEMAERYRAIPLRKEGRELHVGLADPQNLERVDEMVFSFGFPVKPYVITEVTLNYALERYYGIRRETRYLKLAGTEPAELRLTTISEEVEHQRRRSAPGGAAGTTPPPMPTGPPPRANVSYRSTTPPPMTAVGAPPSSGVRVPPQPGAASPMAEGGAPSTLVTGRPITSVGGRPSGSPGAAGPSLSLTPLSSTPPPVATSAPGAGRGTAPSGRMTDLLQRLANVMSDADFLDIVFQYLARIFDEVAILVPRGEIAQGVIIGNRSERRPYAGSLAAPCGAGTLLAEVMTKAQVVYRADLTDPGLLALCRAAVIVPSRIAIIPIFDNRVPVLVAVGQGREQAELLSKVDELRSFLAKASCAFQIIALRKQILTMT